MSRIEEIIRNMISEMPFTLTDKVFPYISEAMQIYARACCEATLQKAAESELTITRFNGKDVTYVDKQSITNHENIILL